MDHRIAQPFRRRHARLTTILGGSVLLVLLSSQAMGAGQFLPIQGVRAIGRAGATTAQGAGPFAIWYNPAGLATLDGLHLYADLTANLFGSSFLRAPRSEPNGEIVVFDEVHNEKGPDVLPAFVTTWDLGLDVVTLGLGLYPPMGYRYAYPIDGPQRYSAVENGQSLSLIIELALAVEITDWLQFGAGFQNLYFDTWSYSIASAWPGIIGQPEDPDFDVVLGLHLVDPLTPTGNLGLRAQVLPTLELALAAQLPARIEDRDSEIVMRMPDHIMFDSAEMSGERVVSGFDLPPIIRFGVRYLHPLGDVELDVVWQGWSVHDAITFEPQGIAIVGLPAIDEFVVRPVELVMDWRDTFSVQVGGDVAVHSMLTARAGFAYERSAIPDERLSVFQMDLDKLAPTVGLTFSLEDIHLAIDVAYSHIFLVGRDIDNSQVTQSNTTFEEGAVVVGNGRYSGHFDLFGMGIEAWF